MWRALGLNVGVFGAGHADFMAISTSCLQHQPKRAAQHMDTKVKIIICHGGIALITVQASLPLDELSSFLTPLRGERRWGLVNLRKAATSALFAAPSCCNASDLDSTKESVVVRSAALPPPTCFHRWRWRLALAWVNGEVAMAAWRGRCRRLSACSGPRWWFTAPLTVDGRRDVRYHSPLWVG